MSDSRPEAAVVASADSVPADWPRFSPPPVELAGPQDPTRPRVLVVAVAASPEEPAPTEDAEGAWGAGVTPACGAEALVAHGIGPGPATAAGWPVAWAQTMPAPAAPARGGPAELVSVAVPPVAGLPARVLATLGLTAETGTRAVRRAGAAVGRAFRGKGPVTVLLPALSDTGLRAFVEGLVLGAYQTPRANPAAADEAGITLVVDDPAAARPALVAGLAHARATTGARDLAATPSNVKGPAWLAARARELEADGVRVRVREVEELRAGGFGGLLAVGAGSSRPPVLVELEYAPEGVDGQPIVLVGKGITYDTGGLSIKPRESMVSMKTDMSGAAVVLETLRACRAAGVRRRVVGLLPTAENAVGAASYRPSDVITQYGGTTVEVANTDAEGRLVLADALAYAVADLDPSCVVDIATLTGAATLGLGKRHAALYATDEELAAALEAAAESSGEQVWRMPLVEDYLPAVESSVADLRHVPEKTGIGGGSITAALFLRSFVGSLPWAHLDVAGTARADKDEHEVTRGATGWGARLLLRWLEADAVPTGGAAADEERGRS
ncbi:MAG: leucyl aminopeptidase family protein [Kineosporiaceae bacterium]